MKKVKYLVAALLLMGATTTFTSCIDNDEPAGITELRGAKAELLKAKAAVELANAAYVDAQTQYELSMVEYQNLWNENLKLENQLKELTLQEQTARTEAAIAEINAKLEQNKLYWEKEKLAAETALAQAQKEYEDAMKALELAKDYLSDNEIKVLTAVQNWQGAAETDMINKRNNLYNAYAIYESAIKDPDNYINKDTLELRIIEKQSDLDVVQNKLTIAQETLEAIKSDDAYQDWLDLKADYETRLDSLELVKADKETKKTEIIASNASGVIKDLQEAVKTMGNPSVVKPETASGKDSTYTVSTAIADEIDGSKFAGFVAYAGGKITAKFKSGGNIMQLRDASTKYADNTSDYKEYETLMDNNYVFADQDGSAYKQAVTDIDNALKAVTDAKNAINPNELAYAKEVQSAAKETMDQDKKTADALIEAWEDAVEAYYSDTTGSYTKMQFVADNAAMQSKIDFVLANSQATDADWTSLYNEFAAYKAKMKTNSQDISKIEDITTVDKLKAAVRADRTAAVLVDGNFKEYKKEEVLLNAAKDAFGAAGVYDGKGVLVRPSDDDVKAAADGGGAYGIYLASVAAYETATDNVEKLTRYDEVIAQLNSYKTSLAALKTAYVAKYQKYIDAVVDAQAAVQEKVVTPIAALQIDAVDQMIKDIKRILNDVSGTTNAGSVSGDTSLVNFDSLIKTLTDEIYGVGKTSGDSDGLMKDVKDAKAALLEAQKMLELFEAGNLNTQYVIEWAEADLERAKAAYEKSVEVFNYWNNALQDLIEKLYNGEDVTVPDTTPDETPEETPDETPEETPAE